MSGICRESNSTKWWTVSDTATVKKWKWHKLHNQWAAVNHQIITQCSSNKLSQIQTTSCNEINFLIKAELMKVCRQHVREYHQIWLLSACKPSTTHHPELYPSTAIHIRFSDEMHQKKSSTTSHMPRSYHKFITELPLLQLLMLRKWIREKLTFSSPDPLG